MSEKTFDLNGRVIVVTGGASGIGEGIATALAQAGAQVVIADLDTERAQQRAQALNEAGHRVLALPLDLTDEASIVQLCAQVTHQLGTPWALVNNAGLQDRQLLLDGTAAEWERMHSVNARGPFLLTREVARSMAAAGTGGRIVNIASAALRGSLVQGLVAYSASKGSLLGLSGASAFELAGHGITVNTVLPGGVATPGAIAAQGPPPQGPAQRPLPLGLCEPSDIAAAVHYFVSPAAGRVTNQVLAVDGGFSVT